MELQGAVALVTGAGRRLGREIALELGRRGCQVVVHFGRSAAAAEATVRDIVDQGGKAVALQADLSDPEAVAPLFEAIATQCHRLDVVVNSAAIFERQPFDAIGLADWERSLAVNLRAPFQVMQCAARLMRARERQVPASIINIGDLSGLRPWPGYVQHGVSKAGLLHLTRIAARELAPLVRVNALVPGAILPPPGVSGDDPGWLARGARLPLGRLGRPAEVTHAVCFLAENDFITGVVLPVDGGEHLLAARGDDQE